MAVASIDMTSLSLLPIFLIGLLGSVHCVGMCGGIVSAFSVGSRTGKKFPVAVVAHNPPARQSGRMQRTIGLVAYNSGRIGSYAVAGALVGGAARGARALAGVSQLQMGGYWLANLMLVALGLYLMGAWRGLARLERVGQLLWQHLQPLTKRLLPLDTPIKMFAVGGLWGWLPCGMVYSVLLTAMLTGSASAGATVMLIFGLGTLPMLLTMGLLGGALRGWIQRPAVRISAGMIVLGFGLLGLLRATHGTPDSWLDAVCLSPFSGSAR